MGDQQEDPVDVRALLQIEITKFATTTFAHFISGRNSGN
jgi:hypothetical protein